MTEDFNENQAAELTQSCHVEWDSSSSRGSSEDSEEDQFRMCDLPEAAATSEPQQSTGDSSPRRLVNFLNFADCNVHEGRRQSHVQNQLLCQQLPPWQLLTETRQLRKLLAAVQEERRAGGEPAPASELSAQLEKTKAELHAKERLLESLAHSLSRAEQDAAKWQHVAMTPRFSDEGLTLSPRSLGWASEGSESVSATPRTWAKSLTPRTDLKLQLPIKMPALQLGAAKIQVVFQLCCAETFFKEELVVVGDHELLGSWKPQAAHPLQTSKPSYPQWQSQRVLAFPAEGPLTLRYKYVRNGSTRGGGYGWEDLIPNRETLILEPLPPGRAWLIRDIAFNFHEAPQVTQIELGDAGEATA